MRPPFYHRKQVRNNAKDALHLFFDTNRKRLERTSGAQPMGKAASRSYAPKSTSNAQKQLEMTFVRLHEIIYTKISTERFPEIFASFMSLQAFAENLLTPSTTNENDDADDKARFWFELAAINACMSLKGKFSQAPVDSDDLLKELLVKLSLKVMETCLQSQLKALKKCHSENPSQILPVPSASVNITQLVDKMILPEDWELQECMAFPASHCRAPAFLKVKHVAPSKIDATFASRISIEGRSRFELCDNELAQGRIERLLDLSCIFAMKSGVFFFDRGRSTQQYFVMREKPKGAEQVSGDMAAVLALQSDGEEEEMDYEDYIHGGAARSREETDSVVSEVGDDDTLDELRALRLHLNGALDTQSRALQGQHRSSTDAHHTLPKLVPGQTTVVFDTNVFLHNLRHVQSIIQSGSWAVSVPLVVITELDGLRASQDAAGIAAAAAISFIETRVSNTAKQTNRLRFQTSQGNFLTNLSVRTESWATATAPGERRRNNDDVILHCCLHYHSAKGPKMDSATSPVVLITGDVNMRLKARTLNVDVRDRVPTL
ncbi:hypothetical protein HKX48_003654 [Thoreauomyces humboldtii]|nr:hypothetical protein HKX48_003654 [Thoreauomyces humboldtii]